MTMGMWQVTPWVLSAISIVVSLGAYRVSRRAVKAAERSALNSERAPYVTNMLNMLDIHMRHLEEFFKAYLEGEGTPEEALKQKSEWSQFRAHFPNGSHPSIIDELLAQLDTMHEIYDTLDTMKGLRGSDQAEFYVKKKELEGRMFGHLGTDLRTLRYIRGQVLYDIQSVPVPMYQEIPISTRIKAEVFCSNLASAAKREAALLRKRIKERFSN